MSKIKAYHESQVTCVIANLSKATGYDHSFLWDVWLDDLNGDINELEYFVGVTLERDW